MMKTCSKCKETKALNEFGKHSGNKDGLQYYCKACRVPIGAASFQKISEEARQRRIKANQDWKKSNPEKVKEYRVVWSKENRHKRTAAQMKRDASKSLRTPKWLTEEQLKEIEDFYLMAAQLSTVFPWKHHVDHIVPMQGSTVSGLHVPWNLQILSAKANIQKGNKHDG
jgi:hypothetical protein